MKKLIALILALAMVFALTACSSETPATQAPAEQTTAAPATEAVTEAPTTEAPTTEAPTTEAPTTEAPTTEAPTTEAPTTEAPTSEAPTTEAPTQSGNVDTDKAAFYANYKENVGEFRFMGENMRIIEDDGTMCMEMVTAENMVKIAVGEHFTAMYVDGTRLYIQTVLPKENGEGTEEKWYVSDIPEGEDPVEGYGAGATEDYVYEDDMIMEYIETVEVDGVKYDRVKVTSPSNNIGATTLNEAIFCFEETEIKVWKIEVEQYDEEFDRMMTASMEFLADVGPMPAAIDPEETEYGDAGEIFSMAMIQLLFGEMEFEP